VNLSAKSFSPEHTLQTYDKFFFPRSELCQQKNFPLTSMQTGLRYICTQRIIASLEGHLNVNILMCVKKAGGLSGTN